MVSQLRTRYYSTQVCAQTHVYSLLPLSRNLMGIKPSEFFLIALILGTTALKNSMISVINGYENGRSNFKQVILFCINSNFISYVQVFLHMKNTL